MPAVFKTITDGDWRIALASAKARRAGAQKRMKESLNRVSAPPPERYTPDARVADLLKSISELPLDATHDRVL